MRRWNAWSLQRRVLVVSAAVATVVIVLGVVAFTTALDRILYSAAQDAARTRAAQIGDSITAGQQPARLALRDITSKGALLQVLDEGGQVIASSEPAVSRSPITTLRPAAGSVDSAQEATIPGEVGEPYAVAARGAADPAGAAYVVVVADPLDVEANTVRTATGLLALGATALLVLLLVLISRILDQALEPVERIRSEVARITQVRGRGHITVPSTGDEIARLAQTMNLMLDRLEQADATTRRFISDASHELRSPLATIRAAIEVSRASGADPGPEPDRDTVVHDEVLRLQHLVEDLLTLAKADDGLRLTLQDVDIDDLVEGEVRRLRATGTVPVTASISAARVVGDPLKLGQALRNLVDNAVTHTSGGIFVGVSTQDDGVVLTVDNDGPPVPVEQRESVFDRFARLEESRTRNRGGSGLGLAIVRTIIEAHGGTVRATQTATGQCRFEAHLPTAAPTVTAPPSRRQA